MNTLMIFYILIIYLIDVSTSNCMIGPEEYNSLMEEFEVLCGKFCNHPLGSICNYVIAAHKTEDEHAIMKLNSYAYMLILEKLAYYEACKKDYDNKFMVQ